MVSDDHGPARKLVEMLKQMAAGMGLTVEQAADLIDYVTRLREENWQKTDPAEIASKWVN